MNALHPATLMDTNMVVSAGIEPRTSVMEGQDRVLLLINGDAPPEPLARGPPGAIGGPRGPRMRLASNERRCASSWITSWVWEGGVRGHHIMDRQQEAQSGRGLTRTDCHIGPTPLKPRGVHPP